MNRRDISPGYLNQEFRVKPGDKLHHFVALLHDTHFDDLTDARIAALEEQVADFRWMSANGERLDR